MHFTPQASLETSANPSRSLHLAVAVGLIAAFMLLVRHLTLPAADPGRRLVWQLTGFSLMAVLAATSAWWLGLPLGLGTGRHPARSAYLAIAFAILVVVTRFFTKQPMAGWATKPASEWIVVAEAYLVSRLLVPVMEELLFRGFLWSSLAATPPKRTWRPTAATLITAGVFGCLHLPSLYGRANAGAFPLVLSAMIAGVAFGVLRQRTGTIYIGLALHIVGNSIGF